MNKEDSHPDREKDSRRILQFRLRTLLLVFVLLAVVLGGWFGWVSPRLAFDACRRDSIARLDWTGKDAAAEYRTQQIRLALEESDYGALSIPRLAYASIYKPAGVLVVDWVAMDRATDVQGIEITGDRTLQMSLDPDYVEHEKGTLIFSVSIRENDNPEYWPQLTGSTSHHLSLIVDEKRRSNKIDLRFVE
jgi:hypothetical protein